MQKYINKYKNKILLLSILLLGFFLRFYIFLKEGFVTTDGVRYIIAGKNLIGSGNYEAFGSPELIFSPGYPILIGITDIMFNNPLFSAHLVSFVASILLVYFVYLVGKKLYNEKVGLFASFLAATNYMLIVLSSETMTESLGLLFILFSVYIYFKILDNYNNYTAALLGLSIGFLYLIRVEGIILLVLPFIFLAQSAKKLEIKKGVKALLIISIGFLIVASPYLNFVYQNTNKLTLTGKSNVNLIVNKIIEGKSISNMTLEETREYEKTFSHYDEETNSVKISDKLRDTTLISEITKDPIQFFNIFFKGILSEIKILFNVYNFNILILALLPFFISFFLTKKHKINEKLFVTILITILFLIIFPIFHIESRYLLQSYIFLIFLASIGLFLEETDMSSKKNIPKKIFFLTLRLFIILFFFLYSILYVYLYKLNYPNEHVLASNYIQNNSRLGDGNAIIMSRKPFVSFYSQNWTNKVPVPYTNIENIIKFAKKMKVNYIIIDQRYLGIRDNYEELLELESYSNDINLVFQDNSISPIRIFELSTK